ncbi:hypothetical protein KY290_010442 [Solanum tuberosum]|uniref:Uncharacterized protein n=1 Tax=Solanum tuberosum TaxID=4113 RepID=A0ABQ7VXU1_SOLTU|nr:hypothetical protein KY289_012392 [Solanum tuberosum]KAH0709336.1 hypothetical protein KY284_010763 [Solanum tuberosum]KAH0735349.1 hypothetical protein KY285_011056 [Solanum tuberosum]KAH0773305.1 hypothetical protein KY290_010442 [Solanum tuberosum]
MHKVGKGKEKTCSSGGTGACWTNPNVRPQPCAVPRFEPDSAKHYMALTILTQIKAAEFLSSLVILFLFLKKRNGFYLVLSSFTSARFVGVFGIPFQWWKLFLAALLVQFQLAAFERD